MSTIVHLIWSCAKIDFDSSKHTIIEMLKEYATYERLILDALNGDGTLFIRGDEAETSWGLLSPVLEYWANQGRRGLESYSAGTWGPLAADKLLLKSGHEWITGKEYGQ